MTSSVYVAHRDTIRVYPRCMHLDKDGECRIGSTYLVPDGDRASPLTWKWERFLCAYHYIKWVSDGGHRFPNTPGFKLNSIAVHVRRHGSVPREE